MPRANPLDNFSNLYLAKNSNPSHSPAMQPLPAKITAATFKSFIRKNRAQLYIKVRGSFDGMTDGIEFSRNAEFRPAVDGEYTNENNLGIAGVWLVKGSRDYFKAFEGEGFYGIEVSNCCGYFTVAIKAESPKHGDITPDPDSPGNSLVTVELPTIGTPDVIATQSEAIPEPPSNIIQFRRIA
jgi:hypothetical protein